MGEVPIIWGDRCRISSKFSDFQEANKYSVLIKFMLWSKGLSLHFFTVLQELCRFTLYFSLAFGLPFKQVYQLLFVVFGHYLKQPFLVPLKLHSISALDSLKHDVAAFMCDIIWCLLQISYSVLQRKMSRPSERTYMSICFCEFLTSCLIFHPRFFLASALKLA